MDKGIETEILRGTTVGHDPALGIPAMSKTRWN